MKLEDVEEAGSEASHQMGRASQEQEPNLHTSDSRDIIFSPRPRHGMGAVASEMT